MKYCCISTLILLVLAVLVVVLSIRSCTPDNLTGEPVDIAWRFEIYKATNARVQDINSAGDLLLGVGGTITLLDRDGGLISQFDDPGQEDACYLQFAPRERIYAATHAGQLYCLDYEGELLWSEYMCGMFGTLNAQQQSECHCCMIAVRSDGSVFAISGSGDAGVFDQDGVVVSSFHAPQHFYHSEPVVLLNDSVAVVQDKDDTVYLYTTGGKLLGTYPCDTFSGMYVVRQDGVLLLAQSKGVLTAINADGEELWSSGNCLPIQRLATLDHIRFIDSLADNRIVVATDRHVALLSDQGELVWCKKLVGDYNDCFVNGGQWIDCIVRESGGFFDFESMIDFGAKFDRPRYLLRYDLDGNEQGCWALPPRTWAVYGPGPAGHYYLYQDDERKEFGRPYPVDLMQLVLTGADPLSVPADGAQAAGA